MKQEQVDINVGSKFDAKGFKQAETALGKLTKTVKNAAGALGIAYGSRAITQFGIAAVKAFAADEAAAIRLSTAVDNLGISFANPEIAAYISNLHYLRDDGHRCGGYRSEKRVCESGTSNR